jgi:hypothetical protein
MGILAPLPSWGAMLNDPRTRTQMTALENSR